jgi:hypothetical protein
VDEPGDQPVDDGPARPQRLYFHVGLPKSGSTYLQTALATNRGALKRHGHLYPFVRQEGMFHAAVEMVGTAARWGLDPDEISGTFAHLLRRGRRLGGSVVISHEIFGFARRDQVRRMGEMLEGFEVHLVVTARDLGRTATAEWQEQVKNGQPISFAEFTGNLLRDLPDDPAQAGGFWRSQNLLRLLERWEPVVPPERMHVVTCPRPGAEPDLLWRRFAEAIDLAPDVVDLSQVPLRNESLGTAQIKLLRDVLVAVGDRLEQPWHSRLAKRWFAQTLLSRGRSAKPVPPRSLSLRLGDVAAAWVDRITAGDYQVHGDLSELLPELAPADAAHPDEVDEVDQLDALPEVIAEMLVRTRELNVRVRDLTRHTAELETERDELLSRVAELTEPRWFDRLARRRSSG